jgi:RNA polymerase sigma-70 factor (ECF subfamily)
MLRFREGDRGAFDDLFRRYTPRLVGFLARMIPERDRAEELAQEVFVRIYQARERYEPKARFSTWIFGIASNLALNDLARARRRYERPLEDSGVERLPDAAPRAEETLEARRTAERLEGALATLPDRQRAALLLRVEQDLGYAEIAEALETSVSSVKSLIHRARTTLTEQMTEEPEK